MASELRGSTGWGQLGFIGYGKGFVFYSKYSFFKNCSTLAEVILGLVLLRDHSAWWRTGRGGQEGKAGTVLVVWGCHTNCHTLGGLRQQAHTLSQFSRARAQNPSVSRAILLESLGENLVSFCSWWLQVPLGLW